MKKLISLNVAKYWKCTFIHTDTSKIISRPLLLNPWPRTLEDTLICSQSRISPHFMESKGSLPHSNSPQLVPILKQIWSVHTFPFEFFKANFNIILPSMPNSCKWVVHSGFLIKTLCTVFFSSTLSTSSAHFILCFITIKVFGKY